MLGERLVRVTGLHFVILFAVFVVKFSSLKLALLEVLETVETVERVEREATEVADFLFSLLVLVVVGGGRDLNREDCSETERQLSRSPT